MFSINHRYSGTEIANIVNPNTINKKNTDSHKIGFLELMPFQAQRHQWGDCMK